MWNKVLLFSLLGLCTLVAQAEPEAHSFLELGIGVLMMDAPDYVGSSHHRLRLIPFPYLKYRGKKLRVDDGIEGRLFESPNLLVSISGNGNLPTSDNNPEREGMKPLDATVEFGPSLDYRFYHLDDQAAWLEMPLRGMFSLGNDTAFLGAVFNPKLSWNQSAKYKESWKLRAATGPVIADRSVNRYFYSVRQTEATTDRPAYQASSGLISWRSDFTFSRRVGSWWVGGFMRYDELSQSENLESPLMTADRHWTVGLSVARVLFEE